MVSLADIRRRLVPFVQSLGPTPKSARGAVALVLKGRSAVEILLIERAEREGDPWSGQLAFPGGRRKPKDRAPLDTARRETKEEVGIGLSRGARLLGWLPAHRPANRVEWVVVPFVFALTRPARLVPGDEAARAFWTPLSALPPSLHKATIPLPWGDLETPAFDVGGKPLWGFSFRVLCDLFDLLGWPEESAAGGPSASNPARVAPSRRGHVGPARSRGP